LTRRQVSRVTPWPAKRWSISCTRGCARQGRSLPAPSWASPG
jgi:hypothetical protein